ncbi:MAG: DUF3859 domain-containing protein [Bacteroidales bacterium]|jgi:hypothetical protein|nr:DUF3859 domain-containing protein [Bacteroidales bacterium]
MAKRKPQFKIDSYGTYKEWNRDSTAIPKLVKIAEKVIFHPDVEFGLVLDIKGGKGQKLVFRIIHPEFNDAEGNSATDFTGEHYVNANTWKFFLGDTVWEPYADKLGLWRFIIDAKGKTVVDISLNIVKE